MKLNKINYEQPPYDIPDTDSGNLRLYWEQEVLRSTYESDKSEKQLERYIQIIDTLGERGQFVDLQCGCVIDKAVRETDWYEMITKPFAGYKNFDHCVRSVSRRKNPPKDPKAYCAKIMRQVEEGRKK